MNTYECFAPDGTRFTTNSVRDYTHAIVARCTGNYHQTAGQWTLVGWRSSEAAAGKAILSIIRWPYHFAAKYYDQVEVVKVSEVHAAESLARKLETETEIIIRKAQRS